jgi:site-specific recombinase XerD
MFRTMRSHELHIPAWFSASELQPHADRFIRYILQCAYSKGTLHAYRNAVAHFAHWMTEHEVALSKLDEMAIERFLSQNLPECHCGALRQRSLYSVRAALKLLMRFLRSEDLVGPAQSTDSPAVTQELQAFAHYQEHVCGFTQATRQVQT